MGSRFNVFSVFAIVTAASLIGMLLGGAFGYFAAKIAPDLFRHVIPWKDLEPVGSATVVGAFGGVICGGALGAFALVMNAFSEWIRTKGAKDT